MKFAIVGLVEKRDEAHEISEIVANYAIGLRAQELSKQSKNKCLVCGGTLPLPLDVCDKCCERFARRI